MFNGETKKQHLGASLLQDLEEGRARPTGALLQRYNIDPNPDGRRNRPNQKKEALEYIMENKGKISFVTYSNYYSTIHYDSGLKATKVNFSISRLVELLGDDFILISKQEIIPLKKVTKVIRKRYDDMTIEANIGEELKKYQVPRGKIKKIFNLLINCGRFDVKKGKYYFKTLTPKDSV